MKKKTTATKSTPRSIALEVPKDVNLAEMSEKEIKNLALNMARKAASSAPANSTLLGLNRVTLASRQTGLPGGGGGIWGEWTRACGRADLAREGLVINPEVFSPVKETLGKSVVRGWKEPGAPATARSAAKKSAKKKSSKKSSKKTSKR